MKNDSELIDKLIKETLSAEEAEFYHQLDEPGLFQMVGGMFQGKLKWFAIVSMIVQFVFVGLAIYCLVEMLNSSETRDTILWAVGLMYCAMTVSMLKLWGWMQMNNYAIINEVKRVELQISVLAHHFPKKDEA